MANDLVTRLLLNSSNFDNNIRKSTKEMQMMQRQAQTIKNGLSSAFLGVGAAIGFATTAQEAFKKVIASSQLLTD